MPCVVVGLYCVIFSEFSTGLTGVMKNVKKSLTFLVKRVDIRQHVCYTKDMVEGQPSNN
nr:MAG TPA: hypothetical protein [Caudoviricetes sp.]